MGNASVADYAVPPHRPPSTAVETMGLGAAAGFTALGKDSLKNAPIQLRSCSLTASS